MRIPEKIVAGDRACIRYEVRDQTPVPSVLFDPETIVASIFDPDGTEVVHEAAMIRESLGRYIFYHQSGVNDLHGVWLTSVKITPANPDGYDGTSTTSLAIDGGIKTFTTQTLLLYQVGDRARCASAADPTRFMEGLVTEYSGVDLTILVDRTGGDGTADDWDVSLVLVNVSPQEPAFTITGPQG